MIFEITQIHLFISTEIKMLSMGIFLASTNVPVRCVHSPVFESISYARSVRMCSNHIAYPGHMNSMV